MLADITEEARTLFRTIWADRPARTTGIGLGLLVVLTLLAYVAAATSDGPLAALVRHEIKPTRDGSLAEIVAYGMSFLAATAFFCTFIETRSKLLLSLSLLMAFVWLDDAARYHERLGGHLVTAFDLQGMWGLRPQDTGELLAWSIAGSVLGLCLCAGLAGRKPGDLGVLALVAAGFAVLVACGVVGDMAHIMAPSELGGELGLVEDGGEMLAIAYIAGLALGLTRNARAYYAAASARTAGHAPVAGSVTAGNPGTEVLRSH